MFCVKNFPLEQVNENKVHRESATQLRDVQNNTGKMGYEIEKSG